VAPRSGPGIGPTWGSTTNQVLALRDHLVTARVTCAVMEATSDYWKPFYYLLEDAGFELMLVNARHVKNLPGRKSDVSDATWLAQLGAHGLSGARSCRPSRSDSYGT
jgi:transposase